MKHPIEVLERYWGHTTFRPLQEDIISSVLKNEDCLALLPTGGGKSICFQIPALLRDGICIVISPLIALMQDQVKSLNDKGIKALALTNIEHPNELDRILDNCMYGGYKFLYLSPERLEKNHVQERIKAIKISLITHQEDLPVNVWTVNKEYDMLKMVEYGVDGIMTDYPLRLKEVCEKENINWF